jgi:hypothetical protein
VAEGTPVGQIQVECVSDCVDNLIRHHYIL